MFLGSVEFLEYFFIFCGSVFFFCYSVVFVNVHKCCLCPYVCVHRDLACVDISVCLQEDRQCLEVPACPLFPEGPVTEKQSVNAEPELHIQYKEERHFQKHPPVCCWCYCCTKHSPTFFPPLLWSAEAGCYSLVSLKPVCILRIDSLSVLVSTGRSRLFFFFFFPHVPMKQRLCGQGCNSGIKWLTQNPPSLQAVRCAPEDQANPATTRKHQSG